MIDDLDAQVERIVVTRAEGQHLLRRDPPPHADGAASSSTPGPPTPSRWPCARGSPIFVEERGDRERPRASKHDRGIDGRRPRPEVARRTVRRRARQVQDVATGPQPVGAATSTPTIPFVLDASSARCLRCRSSPVVHPREAHRVDRHRHRKPEGRRGKDHDGDQPGRRPGHARPAHPPDRSRSAGQLVDQLPRRAQARRDRCSTCCRTAPWPWPTSSPRRPCANLDVAPSRIALAKLESQLVGEMDGPLPPEGPARRAVATATTSSSSTRRRRWASSRSTRWSPRPIC